MKKLLLILSLILFSVSSFAQSRYISKTTKKVVYHKSNGVCQCCGNYEYLEYDHIEPYSCGGSSEASNIQILCRKCNRSKSNGCYCKIHDKKVGAGCCDEKVRAALEAGGSSGNWTFEKKKVFSDFLPVSNGELVNHTYYSLSYSEQHEQAEWVLYERRKERTLGLASRTDDFRSDEMISTNSAILSDYKGTGYDRGHLAPAGDMSFSTTAMSESFYISNMSPQNPSFNRGIWKDLESLVRSWGNNSSIYIVTGPVLDDCISLIGINNVCVPEYYYKVIYDPSEKKMISFILPNEKGTKKLQEYVCTTDSLEKITNIDFFPILEDGLERRLESARNTSEWISTPTKQCSGTTKKEARCRNRTKNTSGRCHHHQ